MGREVEDQAEIRLTIDQCGGGMVGVGDLDLQRDLGMILAQPAHDTREDAIGMAVHRDDADMSLVDALEVSDLCADAAQVSSPAAGQGDDAIPRHGRPHAAGNAIEQGDP